MPPRPGHRPLVRRGSGLGGFWRRRTRSATSRSMGSPARHGRRWGTGPCTSNRCWSADAPCACGAREVELVLHADLDPALDQRAVEVEDGAPDEVCIVHSPWSCGIFAASGVGPCAVLTRPTTERTCAGLPLGMHDRRRRRAGARVAAGSPVQRFLQAPAPSRPGSDRSGRQQQLAGCADALAVVGRPAASAGGSSASG